MPQAPMLPPDQMQAATGGANPINFLIAAADMSKNGQLATQQRSMPKGQSTTLPALRKPRKNIRIIK